MEKPSSHTTTGNCHMHHAQGAVQSYCHCLATTATSAQFTPPVIRRLCPLSSSKPFRAYNVHSLHSHSTSTFMSGILLQNLPSFSNNSHYPSTCRALSMLSVHLLFCLLLLPFWHFHSLLYFLSSFHPVFKHKVQYPCNNVMLLNCLVLSCSTCRSFRHPCKLY